MVMWGRGVSQYDCLHTKLVVKHVQEAMRRHYCCCFVIIIIVVVISIISAIIILPSKHRSEANWKCGNQALTGSVVLVS